MKYADITAKQKEFQELTPHKKNQKAELEQWLNIELSYTSNVIEGNQLTQSEVETILKKGIAIGGKSITDHLEIINHQNALYWISDKSLKQENFNLIEEIKQLHIILLKGIDDENSGQYRKKKSTQTNVDYSKIDYLIRDFSKWLKLDHGLHPVELAVAAYDKLLHIQPFANYNEQLARLMVNRILQKYHYPMFILSKQEHTYYQSKTGESQSQQKEHHQSIFIKKVEQMLDLYKDKLSPQKESPENSTNKLLKIGELAKMAGENKSTIRHWTNLGLLKIEQTTLSGYQLYSIEMIEKIKKIHELKTQRYTLSQIQNIII